MGTVAGDVMELDAAFFRRFVDALGGDARFERVRAAVERVLDNASYREAASRLRDDLRATAGVEQAVEVLTAAAGRARYASAG